MQKLMMKILPAILIFSFITNYSANAHYPRTIEFSGYTWTVKSGNGGPGPNYWNDSEDAVFVDEKGYLHMKITNVDGKFYSSEIHQEESMGYGKYQFVIDGRSEVDKLDGNIVLGLFLYQDDEHEIDIELTNWQRPGAHNVHYSVQPYYKDTNHDGETINLRKSMQSTYTIDWLPSRIKMKSEQRKMSPFVWQYKGENNFTPGEETLNINLWLKDGLSPTDGKEKEIIIKKVKFTPSK